MLGSIEKNFFKITQRLGLLFAMLSFVAVIILGIVSFDKFTATASGKVDAPVIEFSKYQNPISTQGEGTGKDLSTKKEDKFSQEFNNHVEKIVANLERLPEGVIDKTDLKQNVKILVKIRSNPYTQDLQLAYAESLAKLTKQMVNVGGSQVNVDDFFKWYDKEFSKQANANKEQGIQQYFLVKLASVTVDEAIGFAVLGIAAAMLGVFIMFVMMLSMLRVEKNTRK